uniref:Uncharacterized protein n=1 Tax=Sphaerodactylus townsendi TaxID=933632 RepID=A0ACB8FJK8_9SAUR
MEEEELKANEDPEKLPYFLVQVISYMPMMRDESETDVEWVHVVEALLEGKGTTWLVGLFEDNILELQDFNRFMFSLRYQFKDPFQKIMLGRNSSVHTREYRGTLCVSSNSIYRMTLHEKAELPREVSVVL